MAKKFAKINGLFNVFVLNTKNNTQYYDPSKIIDNVVDIDKNTICFVNAADVDINKKIGEYTIKENDRFVITQGGIYAYTGNQNGSSVTPDTPGTSTEDTWRPIYINNTFINDLEFTKSDEYGDIITINPKKPSLDFTTKQTKLTVDGKENAYDILKIDNSYNDIYDKVSLDFGINSNHLKKFIEDVLPKYENLGNGNLSFVLDETVPETGETSTNTIGSFSANQKENTSIKFLAGDNITLEGTNGQLKITGPYIPTQYTTENIIIAEDIEIGGTKLGDIIASEDIFKTDDQRDIIPSGMTLQEVLVKILSGVTPEDWGNPTSIPRMGFVNEVPMVITAKNYYTGETIDLNNTTELEKGTTLLFSYKTEDPNVYQNITVFPFKGGYALENTDEQGNPDSPKYIVHEDTEYQRTFDGVKNSLGSSYYIDIQGFIEEPIKDIEKNQKVLTVNEEENIFSLKQDWNIYPMYFEPYKIYPISNRGTIGVDIPIIINNERFEGFETRGEFSKIIKIKGVDKETLPYYVGIVNNWEKVENVFNFTEGQEISSDSEILVNNVENGIRIEKDDNKAPREINVYTNNGDLLFFIAVPTNQFGQQIDSSNWLLSVVNTSAFNNDVTNIDDVDFKSEKLSVKIDGKEYYLWCIKCKYEDSTFASSVYKITLNK